MTCGLAFVTLAGIYLALTGLVWRLGVGTRDLLCVYWVSALTAAGIGAVTLLHGEVLIAVLALSGALQVELARRLREPRLQLSAAVHIVVGTRSPPCRRATCLPSRLTASPETES